MVWNYRLVPNFFEGMTEYEANYFEILGHQDEINRKLTKDPELRKLLYSRPDRVQIMIELREHGTSNGNASVDPAAVAAYLSKLNDALAAIPSQERTFGGLKTRIVETAKINGGLSMADLLSGIINLLPKDRRGAVFRAPLEEKIRILSQEVTQEVVDKLTGKERDRLHIQTPADVQSAIMAVWQRDQTLELHFALATLASLSQNSIHDGPLNLNLINPELTQLAVLGKKESIAETLRKMLNEHLSKSGSEALGEERKLFGGLVIKPPETHTLTQMPPDIAWSAGCQGGDCVDEENGSLRQFADRPEILCRFHSSGFARIFGNCARRVVRKAPRFRQHDPRKKFGSRPRNRKLDRPSSTGTEAWRRRVDCSQMG